MSELSATMQKALDKITARPGTSLANLPGGRPTASALMRRGLVEIQEDGDDYIRVYLPAHKHAFYTTLHMDGCHWFSSTAKCECGVQLAFRGERSLKADPWSSVWYDEGDECQRCRELSDGARPTYDQTIWRPAGYTPPLETVA